MSGRRRKADQQAEKDGQIVLRLQAADALAQLLRADRGLASNKQHPRRHQAALVYLARYEAVTPPSDREIVKKLLDETQEAFDKDGQEWDTASGMLLQQPNDIPTKVDKLRAYASREDALHKDEAEQMVKELQREALAMRDRAVRGAAGVLD